MPGDSAPVPETVVGSGDCPSPPVRGDAVLTTGAGVLGVGVGVGRDGGVPEGNPDSLLSSSAAGGSSGAVDNGDATGRVHSAVVPLPPPSWPLHVRPLPTLSPTTLDTFLRTHVYPLIIIVSIVKTWE